MGFSDWTYSLCSYITIWDTFPDKFLLLTNHSALPYLREELRFLDWSQYGQPFEHFAASKFEEWDDTLYLQYPTLQFIKPEARWNWECDDSVWRDMVQPSTLVREHVEQY